MQVTISLLPVSLSLVHIPRSRLSSLSHPILRQLLHPDPAFLNITCNEIEFSIFADHQMLQDFEPIARKDRHKQRSRSGSGSNRKGSSSNPPTYEPLEVSYERWRVLQIDSHSDQIGNSGTRVYDLSAPLAAAGISILYQSSYMSDFIFVKESRLKEAIDLFQSSGFHLYTSDTPPPSPAISPVSDDLDSSPSSLNMGAVLTRNINEKAVLMVSNTSAVPLEEPHATPAQNKPHSPTSGEVRILHPDLACVGLSDELGVDHWGLKIIKLVAYPDLIPSSPNVSSRATPKKSNHGEFVPAYLPQPSMVDLSSTALFFHGTEGSDTSSSSSSDDDGYFSHSPQNVSTISLATNTSRSYSDLHSPSCNTSLYKTPSKHFVSDVTPLSPIIPKTRPPLPQLSLSTEASKPEPHVHHFFSFTRTPEGSSLTADVYVLASLFPPHERHMVICSGELDAADRRIEGMDCSDEEDEANDTDTCTRSNSLKCLQIDLRRFGLDKHGLVNRFSRVLEENGINHMYSSTFKTANLLVEKRDAVRAQSLLRSC